jgi:hypothetical protein
MNKESVCLLASVTEAQSWTEIYCVVVCWWRNTAFVLRLVRRTVKSDYFVIFVISIMPSEWNSLAPTERIIMKYYICVFFKNPSGKFKFHCNGTRAEGDFTWRHLWLCYNIPLISCWNESVSDRIVERIKTLILWSIIFFFLQKSCRSERECGKIW